MARRRQVDLVRRLLEQNASAAIDAPGPAQSLGPTASFCESVQAAVDSLPLNGRHGLVFALCGAGLFFESLNLQVMSFVAPMIAREWHIGATLLGTVLSAAIMGMIVGTYLFGAIADRSGRRLTFQLTVGIFSVLTALSGASTALWQLALARFGAGVGIGGSIPVETAVLAEFTPVRWRGRVMAIWAMALPLGAFAAPFSVSLMPASLGWRGLLFLGGLPAALLFVLRRTIPETPQYLASKQRVAETNRALQWIARRPMTIAYRHVGSQARPTFPVNPEGVLFDPAHRRSTAMSWMIYFGSFFGYYGFVLWLPTLLGTYLGLERPQVLHFMLGLALAGLLGRIVVLVMADRADRRRLIMLCAASAVIALVGFAMQTQYALMLAWGYAAAFFLEGIFSVVIPFVAELYPASARASGVGWAGGMGRIGMALAPLAVGLLVQLDVRVAIGSLALGPLLSVIATCVEQRVAGVGAPVE